jgi:transposase
MTSVTLRDDQWKKMLQFLRDHPRVYVGKEERCRQFVEAALWILRTGAQWRALPEQQGKWNSVYKRFGRWCDHGVFDALFDYFSDDADMESVIPDSTIVRAHPCAAGATQKKKPLAVVGVASAPRSTSW